MSPDLRSRVLLFLLAALLGAGIGLFDRGQSQVQPVVLLLFACAFGLAFARPKDAWVYGLVVGSGVPIVELVGRILNLPAPWPSAPGASVFAFVPALLGAGAGALLRIALRR